MFPSHTDFNNVNSSIKINNSFNGGSSFIQEIEPNEDEPPETKKSIQTEWKVSELAGRVESPVGMNMLPPPSQCCIEDHGEKVVSNESATVSWVSPKLEARRGSTGCGIYCISPIEVGEVLVVWSGKLVGTDVALAIMDTDNKHYLLQVGDGFYQIPIFAEREPADFTNHSCRPNAGFGKQSPICLSARLPLNIGDEVTFDYGMCETDERLWEPMECQCGHPECRGLITAHDWKRPELWDRYAGYWAPHVQRRIDAYRESLNCPSPTPSPCSNNNKVDEKDGLDIEHGFVKVQLSPSSNNEKRKNKKKNKAKRKMKGKDNKQGCSSPEVETVNIGASGLSGPSFSETSSGSDNESETTGGHRESRSLSLGEKSNGSNSLGSVIKPVVNQKLNWFDRLLFNYFGILRVTALNQLQI